ncbi:FtsX-like permease family protein [Plantactinospora sp. S1510]|uniref:FtsX-like permease family protein n=1 Tax=Plantactinospora alkalitolerans TaxID=2789879 RepID=A0ABS0H4A5_9ACTN|nr:FtsX-like permease family protein [Plantactinospora alkalitolerans]MBF9133288.1 FtsX-like permease family protein [Plantactinospora alkalitolerans]
MSRLSPLGEVGPATPPPVRTRAERGRSGGGLPARRAVARWAWRLLRRQWRQQILLLALLTLAVMAAVGGVSAAYNVTASRDATFGTASHLLSYEGSDPAALQAALAAAEEFFGTVDVVGRRAAPIPGSADNLQIRAQDPNGAFSGPMLRLRQGRYPTGADELAVTDELAAVFEVGVGDRLTLDGRNRSVVGVVENPSDLGDEFALVSPAHQDPPQTAVVMVRAGADRVHEFRDPGGRRPVTEERGVDPRNAAAAGVLALTTVGLLLICLVAAAGFAVVAQRRLRELGMLAALGATEKHLRLVMVVNGAVVGALAALLGGGTGLAVWVAVGPMFESAVGHRVGRFDLPWPLIGVAALLAVLTATAAAWWPARAVARVPIVLALSRRPPRPKPARRSAIAAIALLGTGVGCLIGAGQHNPWLIIGGTLATAVGLLFASPLAISLLPMVAGGLPVAARLALRDLGRYQARSAAALAAISLGLAIPVGTVVVASASVARSAAAFGNLSDRQLVVRIDRQAAPIVPVRTPAQLASLQVAVDRIAAVIGGGTVIPMDIPVHPDARVESGQAGGEAGRPGIDVGWPVGDGRLRAVPLFVATPAQLRHHGIDPGSLDPGIDVLTVRSEPNLQLSGVRGTGQPLRVQRIDVPAYTSAPTTLLTEDALRRFGWQPGRVGWFVEAPGSLGDDRLGQARHVAADAGLHIESREAPLSLAALQNGVTAGGMLLALGVLAMTVGLIRTEAARDLRTLTAAGATSRVRRTLTAVTAGTLALLGVVLGTLGAYLGLIGGYWGEFDNLSHVPVVHLLALLVGLPLIAAVCGWLLAGREPAAVARQALN